MKLEKLEIVGSDELVSEYQKLRRNEMVPEPRPALILTDSAFRHLRRLPTW